MKATYNATGQKEIEISNGFYRHRGYLLFSVTDTTVIRLAYMEDLCSVTIDRSITQYDNPEQWEPITAAEFIEAYGKARNMQGAAFAEAIRSISPEAIKDVNLTWHPIAY